MSADQHKDSRQWLTINSGLFVGGSVLYGIFVVSKFISRLIQGYTTAALLILIVSVGIYFFLGFKNFIGAWGSFKELEYTESRNKGLIAWGVPVGMLLLSLLMN
jgi:hypothetical protein